MLKLFNKNEKKAQNTITIREILRGTVAGRMQSVGYMQVIPLISEINDERFVSPVEAEVATTQYGTLVFTNPVDKVMLIPTHAGYVVKQAAQDHAMSGAGLLKAKNRKVYNNAMCIQQSQGGYISGGKHKMIILPFSLREKALKVRKQVSYNKLWKEISAFNTQMGAKAAGHLEYFLNMFKDELDQFVAEFEPVPKQVGAIILIDGEIVGVERAPSYKYWLDIWPAIIRECYGSLAIEYQKSMEGKKQESAVRIPLREQVNSLEDIKQALLDASDQEYELAKEKIRELIEDPFKREKDEKEDDFKVETISNDQLYGQMIDEHNNIVYASLITKKSWKKNKAWKQAKDFSI